jgi:hypothetical protein
VGFVVGRHGDVFLGTSKFEFRKSRFDCFANLLEL